MANKGGKNKLKRIAYSGPRHVLKKTDEFLVKPAPGSKKTEKGLSIAVVLRDMLKLGDNIREVKKILFEKNILLNGKKIKDYKLPLGLFDILDLVDAKKKYSLIPNKNRQLDIIEIDYNKPNLRLSKIVGKTTLAGKKIMLSLDNGFNIPAGKGKYKLNDVISYDFNAEKIKDHFEFSEGVRVIFTEGTHIGEVGNIKSITAGDETRKSEIVVKTKKKELRSLRDYVFILPDEFDYLLQ